MAAHGGGGGMIRTILIWLAVAIVAILALLWLLTGGPRKVIDAAQGIGNPVDAIFFFNPSDGDFRLPWQPELPYGPEPAFDEETPSEQSADAAAQLSDAEREYDALQRRIVDAKNFGEPSPYRGQVRIAEHAGDGGPDAEYVAIQATESNSSPVSLAGWSLQSAVTGIRGFIPRGAGVFVVGVVNPQQDIALDPGASAIVASGVSPVGTSFRENICTGYLSQQRSFAPSLSRSCPDPSQVIPLTAENIRLYGEHCIDFVQTIPSCTFPLAMPADLSYECRAYVARKISYNGCVEDNRHRSSFLRASWRIYLGAGAELWRNSHDVVRLLDAEGRTVDVLVY